MSRPGYLVAALKSVVADTTAVQVIQTLCDI